MQISMMTYTMARGVAKGETFDVAECCRFTRELGLTAVDWVTCYGQDPGYVRRVCDDHGLVNVCHTFFVDLNHPTAEGRAAGREAFKAGLEAAVILGADKLMLPIRGSDDYTREQSFTNVCAGLNEIIGDATAAGVTLTVEHFPDPRGPFITADDLQRAVAAVPGLKITFDNGNVSTDGSRASDGWRQNWQDVVHAHFKDYALCDPGTPGSRAYLDGRHRRAVLVGDGETEQLELLRAMAATGYDGCINFEYEGSELTPREATIEGVRRMREWIDVAQAALTETSPS